MNAWGWVLVAGGPLLVTLIVGVGSSAAWDWIKLCWHKLTTSTQIIYDGRRSIAVTDVADDPGIRYDQQGQPYPSSSPLGRMGDGQLDVLAGVIHLKRNNTDGRYGIRLMALRNSGGVGDFISPRPDRSTRSIVVSYEAKVPAGTHRLVCVMYDATNNGWLDWEERKINSSEWETHTFALTIDDADAARRAKIRFDDQDLSTPGSIQIRRLLVTEPKK